MDIFYTNAELELYQVAVTANDTAQVVKNDDRVVDFETYYDMNFISYNDHIVFNANEEVAIQDRPSPSTGIVVSTRVLIEENRRYAIKFALYLNEGGELSVNTLVTDLGEVNEDGI